MLVSPDSTTDYRWQNVTVTGLSAGRDVICRAEFGSFRSGANAARSVTCERRPLVFAVRSAVLNTSVTYEKPTLVERLGRVGETDTLLRAGNLVLVNLTLSGPVYVSSPRLAGGVAEREVGMFEYAKCKLRSNRVDPSAFEGPTPWLEWTPEQCSLNET